jgi:hypothetical protein
LNSTQATNLGGQQRIAALAVSRAIKRWAESWPG